MKTCTRMRQNVWTLAALAIGMSATIIPAAPAQESGAAPAGEEQPYIAVVTGADVYIRCGASESYYPFAKADEGDLVKITGRKPDWLRVSALGETFADTYGYIKHAKGDAGRFRLSEDGKTGTTLGKTEVIAPNLDQKGNAKDSWKSVVRLDPKITLRVLETTHSDKETVHKVVLPESAQGWISEQYVMPASDSQTMQFEQIVEEMKLAAAKPKADASATPAPTSGDEPGVEPIAADKLELDGQAPDAAATDANDQPADDIEAIEPEAIPAPATQPEPVKGPPTIDDLEALFRLLQAEPIETAELAPLREQFIELGNREPKVARRAAARVEQLRTWEDIQAKKHELAEIRARMKSGADDATKARDALIQSAEYTAVGLVATSTIYDGKSLPKLLRLQDPATNRTVAYLKPDEHFKLVNLIGNLVGVVGDKSYDAALRLNIIEPKRIDTLQPEKRQ